MIMEFRMWQLVYKTKIAILKFLGMPTTETQAKQKLNSLIEKKEEIDKKKEEIVTLKKEISEITNSIADSDLLVDIWDKMLVNSIVAENINTSTIGYLIERLGKPSVILPPPPPKQSKIIKNMGDFRSDGSEN